MSCTEYGIASSSFFALNSFFIIINSCVSGWGFRFEDLKPQLFVFYCFILVHTAFFELYKLGLQLNSKIPFVLLIFIYFFEIKYF